MNVNYRSMMRGAKTIIPVLLGVIPFAMISGITAVNTGVSHMTALFMSVFIFAGASQLAILQLLTTNASSLVIIYTALIINFRFMIYSLSIAPYFKSESIAWKAILSYMMTDQSYALSLVRYINDPDEDPKWFFFGASLLLWLVWQIATAVGLILGSLIPPELGLDFAIPLTFTAVLFNSVDDIPTIITVITSAVVAVSTSHIPMNGNLVVAAMTGIAAGTAAELIIGNCKGDHTHA